MNMRVAAFAEKEIIVTLKMDATTASMLKTVLQNPLRGESLADENPEWREWRWTLWKELNEVGVP